VLADDLGIVYGQLKPALEGQHLRETLFFARQSFTRLYEARRLIDVIDSRDDVREFVLGPGEGNEWARFLLDAYRPSDDGSSAVETAFGRFRHHSVHYMWPGSAELRDALRDAGVLPARVWVSDEGVVNQWVQAVSGMLLFGDRTRSDWMKSFQTRSDFAGRLSTCWMMLSGVLLVIYAKERGIDLERLVVHEE
jgi:hypothetical protein